MVRLICSFALAVISLSSSSLAEPVVVDADHLNVASQPITAYFGVASELFSQQESPVHFKSPLKILLDGLNPLSLAVADLNGDGKPDVVIAGCPLSTHCPDLPGAGSVTVFLSNGNGTFQTPVNYSSGGASAVAVAIADINGDGRADVLVANGCQIAGGDCANGGVSVLVGNGDGTFQLPLSYSSGGIAATSISSGDVNGDGFLDIVVTNICESNSNCSNGAGVGEVSVLLGNGDGTFTNPVSYSSGGTYAQSIALSDVNGDGRLDLIVANDCHIGDACFDGEGHGEVSVLLGNGDGTFQFAVSYGSGGTDAVSVDVRDLNSDGRPDLLVANADSNSVGILLGNGDGTFQPASIYSSGGSLVTSMTVADVNGDGLPDLIVANFCGSGSCDEDIVGGVSVLPGNGDGTFQPAVAFQSGGSGAQAVAVGDMNSDGKPDLLVANFRSCPHCSQKGAVGMLLNNLTAASITAIGSSTNPSLVNQSVTFTATIASTPAIPDGSTIAFSQGKVVLGSAPTRKGMASITTSFSTAGKFSVKASYPGDAFHKASSGTVKQIVNP